MTLRSHMATWRATLRALDRSPRTVRSYQDAVESCLDALGPDPAPADLTPAALAAYQRQLAGRLAAKTVALHLTAVRSFARFLVDAEVLTTDPTARIRFPRLRARLPGRALSGEQVRQLLRALRVPDGLPPGDRYQWERNRLAVLLMLYAGLRLAEAAALRWADVDLDGEVLVVRGGKGDKDRSIPLHPALLGELRLAASERRGGTVLATYRGRPLATKSLSHVFERWVPPVLTAAGVEGLHVTAHRLRHTFCTTLISAGAALFDVQELMGHESAETTRRYYTLTAAHLRNAVQRLPEW